ncbi:hypothetical protein QBC35DRAFT_33553 [Podospora australis]|uniref:Fork-head domain-containing protein n=1 Tax=Podospora australis TaxID=1536484 RepID=A0AAN6WN79_9PEZI|nr:hypothetical protein QBC35DRAFT_33553 [Podospora australis]
MSLYALYSTEDPESSSPSTAITTPDALAMDPELCSSITTTTSTSTTTTAPLVPANRITSRHPSVSQSPPNMSPLTHLETLYTVSPQKVVARTTSTTPDPTHAEGRLSVGMDGNYHQRTAAYIPASSEGGPSLWSASMTSQAGSDDLENYTFQGSRVSSGLPQSSPRTWTSPEHVRSLSWDTYPRQSSSSSSHLSPYSYHQTESGMSLTSFPNPDGLPYHHLQQSFDGSEAGEFQLPSRSQTEPYSTTTSSYPPPAEIVVSCGLSTPESNRALSPCSSTLGLKLDGAGSVVPSPKLPHSRHLSVSGTTSGTASEDLTGDSTPPPSIKEELESGGGQHCSSSRLTSGMPSPLIATEGGCGGGAPPSSSPSSGALGASGNKNGEEPYAKLIYRAFMSKPNHAMTLQEIYQWFRENTDKGKDDSKGWQNSIRHNLSMNMAFTKRERRRSSATTTTNALINEDGTSKEQPETAEPKELCLIDTTPGTSTSTSTTSDTAATSKKSTEWFLEEWAVQEGVQSTTRYRKGNQARRSGSGFNSGLLTPTSTSRHHNSYRPYGSSSHSRDSSTSASGGIRKPSSGGLLLGRGSRSASSSISSRHHPQLHHRASLSHHQLMPPQYHYTSPSRQYASMAMVTDSVYGHPAPQFYSQSSSSDTSMQDFLSATDPQLLRATSEGLLSDHEPVTPEPSPYELSSSSSQQQQQQQYYAAAAAAQLGYSHHPHHQHHQLPPHHMGHATGVYDEVVDRFGGWGSTGAGPTAIGYATVMGGDCTEATAAVSGPAAGTVLAAAGYQGHPYQV